MFLFEQRWSTLSKIEVLSFLDSFWLLLVENNSFNMNLPSRGVKDFFVIESINLHLKDWGKKSSTNYNQWLCLYAKAFVHSQRKRAADTLLFYASSCFYPNGVSLLLSMNLIFIHIASSAYILLYTVEHPLNSNILSFEYKFLSLPHSSSFHIVLYFLCSRKTTR